MSGNTAATRVTVFKKHRGLFEREGFSRSRWVDPDLPKHLIDLEQEERRFAPDLQEFAFKNAGVPFFGSYDSWGDSCPGRFCCDGSGFMQESTDDKGQMVVSVSREGVNESELRLVRLYLEDEHRIEQAMRADKSQTWHA